MKTRVVASVAGIAVASILLGGAAPAPARNAAEARNPARELEQNDCDSLPDGAREISGLQTAWAIRSTTPPSLRLFFSSAPFGCRDPQIAPPTGPLDDCVEGWRFGFNLPPELQKPGIYTLSDYDGIGYSDHIVEQMPSKGCGSTACMGTGSGAAGGAKGPDVTIEIYNVTDTCVTGRVLRLTSGFSHGEPDLTGGFRAAVCARAD
ncbi:MAG: hypothetical protein ABW133_07090 [Polyangiaceae bacterium]